MELSNEVQTKLNNLLNYVKGKKIVVAFSGGVDSSLLAYIASQYSEETILITESSILYPEEEIEDAKAFAQDYGITHIVLKRDPLKNKEYKSNPANRCYICKKELYQHINRMMAPRNFDMIIEGSNVDDLSDYRPGMQALKELGIHSPYVDLNITKKEIREIANHLGLNVHSKPSMACFASRIPYGEKISRKLLDRIKQAEHFLKQQFNLNQVRVRYHQNGLARIEFLKDDFAMILSPGNLNIIEIKFKELEFQYITIDVEGFRSGSMNKMLDL